ncbi:aldo/keto reductase [Peredibacter sp. HCB2-198]|uniref:aldo/keto reductase n=1 Tax=Peredibacter sp. HCB2-198 TaxID=3383025 RepID=UPI0038B4C631
MQTITFHNNNTMPQLGFGLWQVPDDEAVKAVSEAFKVGYRSIDSAQIYQNESGLGEAIKRSHITRDELFITTKVWNEQHGYDSALRSFDESMKKLGLERLDLLLIHWPAPKKNLYVDTWKALIQLQKEKRVTNIGVSNFTPTCLDRIIDATGVVPVLNQIELHPHFQQKELRAYHAKHKIKTESWSPLGRGQVIQDPVIGQIAAKHKKTPAQVILRWHLDNGLIVIPKSVTPSRIAENFHVFDFKLDDADLKAIEKLDQVNGRIGPDPDTATF